MVSASSLSHIISSALDASLNNNRLVSYIIKMDDNQIQQPQLHNPIEPPQSFVQRWLPTIIGIAIVVFVGGGVLVWNFFVRTDTGTTKIEEVAPAEFLGVGERIDQGETANWNTYGNEEFGFEVKYPSTLLAFETEGDYTYGGTVYKRFFPNLSGVEKEGLSSPMFQVGFFPVKPRIVVGRNFSEDILIFVSRQEKLEVIEAFLSFERNNEKWGWRILNEGNKEVKGLQVYEIVGGTTKPEANRKISIFENGDLIFVMVAFDLLDEEFLEEKFDQILSTFKFID